MPLFAAVITRDYEPVCAAPVASQYAITGLGGFGSVLRGSALSIAFIRQFSAISKSPLSGRGSPAIVEYCLGENGFSRARPIDPNKSDFVNPSFPLIVAVCSGVR